MGVLTRIWEDSPVVTEWTAFHKRENDAHAECADECCQVYNECRFPPGHIVNQPSVKYK
jgi:hypothetical protein